MTIQTASKYVSGRPASPSDIFRFTSQVKYGRGNVQVEMEVPGETILALAEAYRHCRHAGHAAWHVRENNINFSECSTCQEKSVPHENHEA